MSITAVPRGPAAQAVALEPHAFVPGELVALTAHDDATVARLALESLAVQFSLRARLAHTAGAPTHTRTPPGGDSGLLHILGPSPKREVDHA